LNTRKKTKNKIKKKISKIVNEINNISIKKKKKSYIKNQTEDLKIDLAAGGGSILSLTRT
jgi:hypothetical protein